MRIIGGQFKGRRFNPPAKNWPTRPTTDFAKEGLFNILSNRLEFENLKVLDLFGGTGNISYEMISRGCKDVTYVDNFPSCIRFVTEIAKDLEIKTFITIVKADVIKFIATNNNGYDLIFADPPYDISALETIPNIIFEKNILNPEGLFILEHGTKHSFKNHIHFIEDRRYGDSIFSFFK
jgi:16S rRNA (guanine966-N2)-methyltransferase